MSDKPLVSGYNGAQFGGQSSPVNRPHEWTLARMLEIGANPESAEGKGMARRLADVETHMFARELSGMEYLPESIKTPYVDEFKSRRELLLSEAVESTTLIQEEFYSTVLEGAEPNKVIRNALRVIPMGSNQQSFTLGETGAVLPRVAEGAELTNNQQDYSKVTLTSVKYGEKGIISNELIEDAMYDVMALEVAKSGARAENTLNHVSLTMLLDDAGNEHDCTGSNLGYQALAGARKEMKVDGYRPDVGIICADAEYQLSIDSQMSYSSYYGSSGVTPVVAGTIPPVFGVRFFTLDPFDTTYDSSTYTWEYNSDGDIGMVLVDSASLAGVIGMRRDITVKDYDDPIRDLKGAALTMRFAVGSPFDNGICRVEY